MLQTQLQGVEKLVFNIQPEILFYSQKPVNYNAKLQSLSNNLHVEQQKAKITKRYMSQCHFCTALTNVPSVWQVPINWPIGYDNWVINNQPQ